MATEEARHELREAARRGFGDGPAATLMELFAMDLDRVATKEDLVELRSELRDENAKRHTEITELRSELRDENAKRHGELTQVRGEITDLRGSILLDNARQTRQLTLTILIAVVAQFAATVSVVLSAV